MADIDTLSIKISASTGRASKNIDRLTESLIRLNSALGSINPNVFGMFSQAASTMSSMTTNAQTCQRAMTTLSQAMNAVPQANSGLTQTASAAQNLSNATQQAAQNVGGMASATQQVGGAVQTSTSQVNNLANAAQRVSRNTSSSASSLKSFGRSTKEASKHASIFAKELTRIGKMMKLMITRMILRKVIQGVLDGFKNLAQYSSTFDASLSLLWNSFRQLGNSIAAAVSPLLNALAPALNYIIQLVIKAVNVINQLISALTGMGTWTRAKTLTDDYAKSLDKSNKSAKALKKTVLGFDELNQLQDNKDSGGGGTSPADMFEQVPIDPKILKFIEDLKNKIAGLKKYWDAFLNGFKKGLGDDWKNKVALIKDGLIRIKDALKDIWEDDAVSEARERFFLSFAEMVGAVAGTVARIGLNIGANLAQGVADALEEKSPEIKDYLVEMFNIGTDMTSQVEEFALAVGEISDVLVGENAIAATKGFTEIFTEAFMLVTENAARLGSDILTLITQPIIDNKEAISAALDDMFGKLAEYADFVQGVIKDVRDILSQVWNDHLHPMFDSLTKALSSLTEVVLNAWGYISPVVDEVIATAKELWATYLKPIFDDVINIIGIVANLIAKAVNSVVVPAISALVDKWFPRIRDAISIVISIFKVAFQTVSTIIQTITFTLRSFLQFFETGFTKGWGTACEELATSWAKQWDNILEKVKSIGLSIVEVVENMINAIIHGLNHFGDKIGGMADVQLPAWLGGGTFTFKGLAFHFDDVSIKSLFSKGGGRGFASGGFPEDGLFMANHNELVGKFSNGRTAVANNEQITDGIARAVFNAMVSANSGGRSEYINNTIVVDGVAIARAVTQGQETLNRRYSPTMA